MIRFVVSRRSLAAIMIGGLIAIVGTLIVSPFALAELGHYRTDWAQLSNIGQTYGAVSALLTPLALGGVVASLLYQARDSRNALEQTTRTLQFELIRMELDDPSLMTALGAPWDLAIPSDSVSIREYLYVQMWVSFWGGNYTNGGMPESAIRHFAAHELFRSRAGRAYWAAVGKLQIAHSKGALNQFFRFLDDEYEKALATGSPVANPVIISGTRAKHQEPLRHQELTINRTKHTQLLPVVGGMTLGALASWLWSRRKARQS
jgi:Family of unknown function (DUF6082)